MDAQIPAEVAGQIAEFVYGGRKIEAIKLYREHSGRGLKEAKDLMPDGTTKDARRVTVKAGETVEVDVEKR